MLIRQAVPEDIPSIMAIIDRVIPLMHAVSNHQWGDGYPGPAVFARDIAGGHLWVADLGGLIGGVVAITLDHPDYYLDTDWPIDPTPSITPHRLAVHPDLGGRGIASRLMHKAEEIAHEQAIPLLRADTDKLNPVTNYLFPRLGYQLAGTFRVDFRPGMRFLCYEKRLTL